MPYHTFNILKGQLKGSLKNKRIGIEKSHLQGHEAVVAIYKEAIELMKRMGATIVEIELLKSIRGMGNASLMCCCMNLKMD